jgi:hypothetical protein
VIAKESPDATVFEPPVKLPAEYKIPVVVSLVAEADAPELIKQPFTVPELVIAKVNAAPVLLVMFDGVVPAEVAAVQLTDWRLPVYVGALAKPTSSQVCEAIVSAAV